MQFHPLREMSLLSLTLVETVAAQETAGASAEMSSA